jgi:hypothetical protein
MPKSKLRKNHKQKVASRRQNLLQEKKKRENFQREFIMNLIKQEQERGMFENTTSLSGLQLDGPMLDTLTIDGPQLELPNSQTENIESREDRG